MFENRHCAVTHSSPPPAETNGGYITSDIDDCFCHSPDMFSNQSVLEFFSNAGLSPCSESAAPASPTRMLLTMVPVFVSG